MCVTLSVKRVEGKRANLAQHLLADLDIGDFLLLHTGSMMTAGEESTAENSP